MYDLVIARCFEDHLYVDTSVDTSVRLFNSSITELAVQPVDRTPIPAVRANDAYSYVIQSDSSAQHQTKNFKVS